MQKRSTHWVSSKLESRPNPAKGNFGVFAKEFVPKGELIICWGGDIVTSAQFALLSPHEREHSSQVEDDLYQVPCRADEEPGDYVNHSCMPNTGFTSSISLVALRDIEPDEEICIDYAMCDSTPYDEFACGCGTAACRGRITGNDWQLPHLQTRYNGYFSPYLQRRIDKLQRKTVA